MEGITAVDEVITTEQVFAAYGEALYLAQSMETGMRIFYWLDKALPKAPPGKLPRINFDEEATDEFFMNSLGGFIRQFRRELFEEGAVDAETRTLMRKLEQAVDERNRLVHTYWWEYTNELSTTEGRTRLLQELQALIFKFRQHDEMIRRFIRIYFLHYNLDPRKVESPRFQAYLAQGFE